MLDALRATSEPVDALTRHRAPAQRAASSRTAGGAADDRRARRRGPRRRQRSAATRGSSARTRCCAGCCTRLRDPGARPRPRGAAARPRRAGRARDPRGRPRRPPQGLPRDRARCSTPSSTSCRSSRARASSITGTPSGFEDLDEITGGFQPGNLIILAARPSMGKSALVTQHRRERRARQHDRGRSRCSRLEMSEAELAQRFIACRRRSRATTCARAASPRTRWREDPRRRRRARRGAAVRRRLVGPRRCSSPRQGAPAAPAARRRPRADHRRLPAADARRRARSRTASSRSARCRAG